MIAQSWVELANTWGNRWFQTCQWLVIETTVLFLILWIVWWVVRRFTQPQVGYWLLLLVPLKLLLPITLDVPERIARWSPSNAVVQHVAYERKGDVQSLRPTLDAVPMESSANDGISDSREQKPTKQPSQRVDDAHFSASLGPALSSEPNELEAASIGVTTFLMFAWLAVVASLLAIFVRRQWRLTANLRRSPEIEGSIGTVQVADLLAASGIRRNVRFVESDCVSAPAVSGVWRPVVIVPYGFSQLPAQSVRWALLHELGHVRRHDLVAVWFQRIAGILWFFHPIVWIANRMIDQQREYICDDLAEAWSSRLDEGDDTAASEAFVNTLRFANDRAVSVTALSVLGFGSKKTCQQRVVRLLNETRPKARRLRWWAVSLVAFAGLAVIPQLRAEPEPPDTIAVVERTAVVEASTVTDEENQHDDKPDFVLSIVDPQGKPIKNAEVRFGVSPGVDPQDITHGTLGRGGNSRFYVETDADGKYRHEFLQASLLVQLYGSCSQLWAVSRRVEPVEKRRGRSENVHIET